MKKLFSILLLFIVVFALTGCGAFEDGEPIDYSDELKDIEARLDEMEEWEAEVIEVPLIVKDVQIIEVAGETIIEYVDVIVTEYVMTKSLFYPSGTNLAILTIAKGVVSYTIEYEYVAPLIGTPSLEAVKMERQLNGISDDWFLFNAHSDINFVEQFTTNVVDYDDFVKKLEYNRDAMTWTDLEEIYLILYNDYYDVD